MISHRRSTRILSQSLRLALLLASSGLAATVAAAAAVPAPAETPGNPELADIVVTATRSGAESLQKVAIPISVVNVDQITKSNQGNLVDLAKFSPSLAITEGAPGFNKFNMRGLSTGGYRTSDTSDRSLVAVYLDDTPISVQGQTPDLKVYDLERVEILRGPQGTLFGAGSMAGTIRFVTAKPDLNKFFGSVEADGAGTEHGNGSYNARGMVNLPVVAGQLAIRGNFYIGKDGGFIDNIGAYNRKDANSNRTTQARVAARWTPTDKLTVDGSFTYEQSRAHGLNTAFSGLPAYTTSTNSPEGTSDKFRLYQLGADYDLGFADFIATAAYTDRDIGFNASVEPQIGYFFQDYGSKLPIGTGTYPVFTAPTTYNQAITNALPAEKYTINNKIKDFMIEGRLASKNDGPVKWTAGVFYETQKRHLIQDIPTPGFDTLSYENYFYGPFATPTGRYDSKLVDGAFSSNDIFSGLQDVDEHQVAVYADGTWHVTPKLDLTAGLRYFNFEEKYFLFEGGVYGVINHVPLTQNATLKSNGVNPRANISYKPNDDLLIYAEAAKGFRYGGANQPVPVGTTGVAGQCAANLASYGYTAAPLTFGPDKLWNYTIGEKAKLADGRVTLNASAYYIDWQDVQTRLLLNCSYFFTANKGKITSKGLELESMVKVSPEFTLSLGGSINDSRANGDIPTVGAFNGDHTPYFPKLVFNFGAFYDVPVGNGELHLQGNYQFQSNQNTTFNRFSTTIVNGVLTKNGASSTFATIPESSNVSLSVAYDIGNFEFGIFGNNLTNGVKITNIARATYYQIYQAGSSVTYARPRTIGGRVKVKF
ncbi:TonB-dependent receptor [Glacieibacterium megasporae]|uniref:TonB-dependent receptor n=1 Tax=Glacieibacterium megasporae TaxID=2835787 RepID=UPI001C1E33AF|nr:TonB-dependent receptor [Polymorphobacter megasporae]UAJ08856.1 TonB-dependent receptor [Polymorphobacter megasporae]